MMLEKTRSRRKSPKLSNSRSGKQDQPIRKLPAKRKRSIDRKAGFPAQDNPLKIYHAKRTFEETKAFAEKLRREKLENPTPGEEAFSQILKDLGIAFEREKIWYAGTRFIMVDFELTGRNIIVEIDGSSHQQQHKYDQSRDRWFDALGFKVCRVTNNQVIRNPEAVTIAVKALIPSMRVNEDL